MKIRGLNIKNKISKRVYDISLLLLGCIVLLCVMLRYFNQYQGLVVTPDEFGYYNIYGRYMEYTILPVIYLGFEVLYKKKIHVREITAIGGIYLVVSLLLSYVYTSSELDSIVSNTVSGVYKLFRDNYKGNFMFPLCIQRIFVFAFIILCIYYGHKKRYVFLAFIVVCSVWVSNYTAQVENESLPYYAGTDYIGLADYVNEASDKPIYFVYDENDIQYNKTRIFGLQFLCKDTYINTLTYQEFAEQDLRDIYIIVNSSSNCYSQISESADLVAKGKPLEFYVYYGD